MAGATAVRAAAASLSDGITASGGQRVPITLPFTGEVGHELPHSTLDDVTDAAARARAAQHAWQAAGFAHRRRVLLAAHDLLLARRGELIDLLQLETGRSRGPAFEEFFQGVNITRYAAVHARRVLAPHRRRAGIPLAITTEVQYEPKQLVGVVTPWNYPLGLALMDIVPALAAGCAVLQKPDDQAALSVLAARACFIEAGVPAELWAVVTGPGESVGNALIDTVDHLCFTGSTRTGAAVGQRAAARLIGSSLELGGKNAVIVLDDVNIPDAVPAVANACFAAAGQLCVSAERILVQRSIAEPFIAALASHVAALRLGPDLDYSADVGSLATAAQLERVRAHVEDAVVKGATVLAGGQHRPDLGPFFFEPTLLSGVSAGMACHGEETFGPVAAITVIEDDEEAIAAANASDFGLNAAVFGSPARAARIARRLHSGSVNINEGFRASFSSVDAPQGGMRRSGLGRRNGPEGILRFAQPRTVSRATGLIRLPQHGAEYPPLTGLMVTLLQVLNALRRR